MSKNLFTIGHSNHSIEKFISLLKQHRVTAIADVRSSPYSRYLTHFNKADLILHLKKAGISYVFLGKELGARPTDDSCYVDGKAIYEKIAKRNEFRQGIKRVLEGSKKYDIALMCAEKDPITCHRAVLICQYLSKSDLDINHIHKDGSLEQHYKLEDRLLELDGYNEPIQFNLLDSSVAVLAQKKVSKEKSLKEAYINQGLKIAYVEKENINETIY